MIGDGLRIFARCPDDGIIEALEGTAPDHFVLAVQWHPERSVDEDEASRAIFRALIEAAENTARDEFKRPANLRSSSSGALSFFRALFRDASPAARPHARSQHSPG